VCDGTADQEEINAALAAVTPSTSGRVLLLEGTFIVSGAINFTTSHTVLEGQGDATTIQIVTDAGLAGQLIYAASLTNVKVANLKINANGSNQATGKAYCVNFDNCTDCVVDGVTIINATKSFSIGIYLDTCSRGVIQNCSISDCLSQTGIYLEYCSATSISCCHTDDVGHPVDLNENDGTVISNCTFILDSGSGIGIDSYNETNLMVIGNYIRFVEDVGMYLDGGSTTPTMNATITGNAFDRCVYGFSAADCYDTVVSSNTFRNCEYAVYIGGGKHLLFVGNIISGIHPDGGSTGFDIGSTAYSYYYTIIGNHISYLDYHGIYVYRRTESIRISNNTIIGVGQDTDDTYSAIFIDANATYTSENGIIDSNTCRVGNETNQPKYGVCIDDSNVSAFIIKDNDLRSSGKTASLLDSGTGTITDGNYT
jgi:parallel beta-helix repeat protein